MSSPSTSSACTLCKGGLAVVVTDLESGELICCNCGIVICDKIEDTTQEWRAYTLEEVKERVRVGVPTSLARHDMGLYTVIGKANKDASGQVLDVAVSSTMQRLRTWDFRIQLHNSNDRNFILAFQKLDMLKYKLGLSYAIVEKTAYIYRKAQEKRLVAGRTISGILAAAVCIACREMETPRTLKDISAASNIKHKDIARNYRLLIKELDIKIPIVDPMKCIAKVANNANLSERTKREAMTIMREIVNREMCAGRNPMGLAAVALYIACKMTGEYRTQTEIAKVAGITEVTIRNRFKDLQNNLQLYVV
jgi:transcription initiation factor TFIIB